MIRNKEYWIEKIEENISRDEKVDIELTQLGWIPVHFWSKRVTENVRACVNEIEDIVEEIIIDLYYE